MPVITTPTSLPKSSIVRSPQASRRKVSSSAQEQQTPPKQQSPPQPAASAPPAAQSQPGKAVPFTQKPPAQTLVEKLAHRACHALPAAAAARQAITRNRDGSMTIPVELVDLENVGDAGNGTLPWWERMAKLMPPSPFPATEVYAKYTLQHRQMLSNS